MSLMASLVTTSQMQQCFNVLIDTCHEFRLLFYCCVLLEIKRTTTTTWVNFEFVRNFHLEETVAAWPVSCFRWKPPLLIPSHLTSGLPAPRWFVNKAPQSLAHCHASVVWWAATGNITPCRVCWQTQDLPRGKPVPWPLGHGNCTSDITFIMTRYRRLGFTNFNTSSGFLWNGYPDLGSISI